MKRLALAVLLACAPLAGARANDSIGNLAAGGIVLAQSADIEMRAEDLYVSTAEIRVRYRFFNHADHDVTTLVAFPLPDVPAPSEMDNYALPVEDSANFLGFETKVDGQPVQMQLEQHASALGIDRTERLKQLGVPLAPQLEATLSAVQALPEPAVRELLADGVVRTEEYDVGQGMKTYIHPSWTLRTVYYWQQVFPKGRELIVEHRYKPSVGSTAGTIVGTGYGEPQHLAAYRQRYCIDDDFIRAAKRGNAAAAKAGGALFEQRLDYVLTTGANWAGPIGDFHLVVDKGAPDSLVSFCAEGVKKIAPTQFEVRKTSYWPDRDLAVLILKPSQ
jgi:hypothetical protein